MTISGALSNALTGLRAAGRSAEVVSSNIANARTPGYARRVLNLSSGEMGVRIGGLTRIVDASLVADHRLATAEHAHAQTAADFLTRMGTLLGTPDEPSSLSARYATFENALITASSRPDAPERLASVGAAAQDVVRGLNAAAQGIQDARTIADRTIAQQVDQLNTSLQQVAALNGQIIEARAQGGDATALLDHRQSLVSEISELVPVREAARDRGAIALYTLGGAILLDGSPAQVGFDPSNLVTPYMRIESATLSGLTVNGNPVATGTGNGALRGGSIGAQFAIRDELGTQAQAQVDAIARDLITRFQDPAVDPTLTLGDAGLFTDSGGAFDAINERGIANRLSLNAAVDPDQGGAVWRMRDGINAATAGPAGDATILQNLTAILNAPLVPGSSGFGSGAYSASGLLATVTSGISAERTMADRSLSFASTRLSELTSRQLADGVDTDAELQKLMVIEQAYAANARVIEAVDEMMQTIMRL